jgi:hypothetical protein
MKKLLHSILALALMAGCSHQLEVKNLSSYRNMQLHSLGRSTSVGMVPSTDDIHSQQLMKGIATGLARHSAQVSLPYLQENSKKVDVIANISIRPTYKGSAANFFINFPGFLVWAPAWHGYNYKVKYHMEVLLLDGRDKSKIDSFTLPIELDVRHADIDRTWTEISWLEVGAIAFVGGLAFTQYDSGVTPLLVSAIETPIGDYVANEMVSRVRQRSRPTGAPEKP